jgi:hypothetical protein
MLVETINAIGSTVAGAIQKAAQATGTGFSYLLATAKIESGLDPQVKAKTSSATGLFQFIEQTWLQTVKQSGAELGYGQHADAIERTSSGKYVVRDPAKRAEILNLRKDPTANAAMAGALTRSNAGRLKAKLGRDATEGELYMAHFLGAGGATKLITSAANNPNGKAANLFPRAAAANRPIFYDKQGGARSAAGVYNLLNTKVARAMPIQPGQPATQVAQAAKTEPGPVTAPAQRSAFIPAQRRGAAPVAAVASAPAQPATLIPAIRRPGIAAPTQVAAAAPAQAAAAAANKVAEVEPASFASRWDLLSPQRVNSVAPQLPSPPLSASVAPLLFAQSQVQSQAPPAIAAPAATTPPAPTTANTQVASGHQVFHDLFSTNGRGPISKAVAELWGVRSAGAAELNPPVAPAGASDKPPASASDPYRASRPRN